MKPYESAVFQFLQKFCPEDVFLTTVSPDRVTEVRIGVIEGSHSCGNCDPEDYGSQDYGPEAYVDIFFVNEEGKADSYAIFNTSFTMGELVEGAARYMKL